MYSHTVSFTVPQESPENVRSPFIPGKRDSVQVKTRTDDEQHIKEQACKKLLTCYGMVIQPEDMEVYNGFEY